MGKVTDWVRRKLFRLDGEVSGSGYFSGVCRFMRTYAHSKVKIPNIYLKATMSPVSPENLIALRLKPRMADRSHTEYRNAENGSIMNKNSLCNKELSYIKSTSSCMNSFD